MQGHYGKDDLIGGHHSVYAPGGTRQRVINFDEGQQQHVSMGAFVYSDTTGSLYGFNNDGQRVDLSNDAHQLLPTLQNFSKGPTVLLQGAPGQAQPYLFSKTNSIAPNWRLSPFDTPQQFWKLYSGLSGPQSDDSYYKSTGEASIDFTQHMKQNAGDSIAQGVYGFGKFLTKGVTFLFDQVVDAVANTSLGIETGGMSIAAQLLMPGPGSLATNILGIDGAIDKVVEQAAMNPTERREQQIAQDIASGNVTSRDRLEHYFMSRFGILPNNADTTMNPAGIQQFLKDPRVGMSPQQMTPPPQPKTTYQEQASVLQQEISARNSLQPVAAAVAQHHIEGASAVQSAAEAKGIPTGRLQMIKHSLRSNPYDLDKYADLHDESFKLRAQIARNARLGL